MARKKIKDSLFFCNGIDDIHNWGGSDGIGELRDIPKPKFVSKYKKRLKPPKIPNPRRI